MNLRSFINMLMVSGVLLSSACRQPDAQVSVGLEPGEAFSGGETTVFNASVEAFSKPSANLITSRRGHFFVGNGFFSDPWVIAPATTAARDGLGPLFNVSACQSCHIKDGRGHAPIGPEDEADSYLIRLSQPAITPQQQAQLKSGKQGNIPDSRYGGQIQDRAIPGVPAEARIRVHYTPVPVELADGLIVELRQPTIELMQLAYGPLDAETIVSPRVAQQMIGLGLLEVIPEVDIIAQADELDHDGDGISGRVNRVWSVAQQRLVLGRFGWKLGQPSIAQQNAGAFNGDIGITSEWFQQESCTQVQTDCLAQPSGVNEFEAVEVSSEILGFVEFYARNLAVPGRRQEADPEVLAGKQIFYEIGCVACHTPSYQLPEILADHPDHIEQANQVIFPYTDMLLHDMGPELADRYADGRTVADDQQVEFLATASEFRTPPLWGIGLAKTVDEDATFLHDGRARTVMEAVLWHGGEAEASREAVLALVATERNQLEQFLQSL